MYWTLADGTSLPLKQTKVELRDDDGGYGTTKLAITPASGALNSGVISIYKYEDIYSVKNYTSYTWNSYAYINRTRAITFTPPSSGSYTFETTSAIDTYLYVIAPNSVNAIEISKNYDDDSGDGYNSKITTTLTATKPLTLSIKRN